MTVFDIANKENENKAVNKRKSVQMEYARPQSHLRFSNHSHSPPPSKAQPGLPQLSTRFVSTSAPTSNPLSKMRKTTSTNKNLSRPISESHRLRQLIYEKQLELDSLNTESVTLTTQTETQLLHNFTIENEYMTFERELSKLKSNIESLRDYEQISLSEVRKKFDIKSQEMMIRHQKRLHARKESIASQIEKIMAEKQEKYDNEIDELNKKLVDLNEEKDLLQQSYQQNVAFFKEQKLMETDKMETTLQKELQSNESSMEQIEQSILDLQKQTNVLTEMDIPKLEKDLGRYQSLLAQLSTKNSDKEKELQDFQTQISANKARITSLKQTSVLRAEESERMQFEIKRMQEELIDQDFKRRILHSQLQELKGNIRVFCRIRAVSPGSSLIQFDLPDDDDDDDDGGDDDGDNGGDGIKSNTNTNTNVNININDEGKQELTMTKNNIGISNTSSTFKFQFDKIFSMSQSNEAIFEEFSQLIQCCIDGQNVCVFAYGQTGSGKTYTMSTPQTGMIPLSIAKIFNDIDEFQQHHQQWRYKVSGRFIEIYNENIVDLLNPRPGHKHEIKHDDDSCKTSISDVTTIPITSPEQANSVLEQVNERRRTAATKSNDKSSRSHSIFILDVHGINVSSNIKTYGTLNLIDLAGSERINVSQVEGERLKETQAINKSLSSLGDVISSINSSQALHIPYRNSKLTYLLKHSLGGNSKTLMFVNVSPLQSDFNETLNSLRFATKVNNTKLKK
ncbi:kinesin-like nuclear fusion protein [Lodderomyces elongisporus]|uniref:kinesin-like nuclear fusion protein n=1 Tax=Lodderomyces elongisporus TaxID=36914 RepID=UPI002924D3E6|nr:kinesin-like nuclear fusion protein [Lodderomyces elongisporus]WLF80547.1 kinesin-like nuclear fusion protein [Lodderomyces elongisporus]